jgi:uncharacterized protein YdaT
MEVSIFSQLDEVEEQELKEAADELELVANMASQIDFDNSVLVSSVEEDKNTNQDITVLSDTGQPITGEFLGRSQVPLCSPAAKFLTESKKKILIPDFSESDDENERETYICGECGKAFPDEDEVNTHMTNIHRERKSKETVHSAGDHKCTECNYRTNFAVHYYQHCLDHHTPKVLEPIIFSKKPIVKPIIFFLAEHNMALAEETRRLRKDLDYIKKVLKPKGPSTKFNCQKCNDLSSSPTKIQEHILEDHCCKYCEKTFSSKIEKEHHKKYMCTVCEKTFSHNLELHIHTKTYHKKEENASKVATKIPRDLPIVQEREYKCTECSHQEETEEALIHHIESNHAAILSPAKVIRPIPAPRGKKVSVIRKLLQCPECNQQEVIEDNLIRHMEREHTALFSQHTFCDSESAKEDNLEKHKETKHSKYPKLHNWFLIGDSHINSIKLGMVEKSTKGKLFCKGYVHPKEGRAYCSSKDWPNARYPSNNHSEMTPKLTKERSYTGGVILCPSNDISNLT